MAWKYDPFKASSETENADLERKSIASMKPSDFTYADYVESDSVKQAKDQLNSLQKPTAYQSQWQKSINDTINKILNREKFSYDVNGDALYQQYKDLYTTQGKMAMMDTIGQAATLTGGYGNSYAQNVGQQAYQGYLQQLNDKIPELYKLALDQYNREGDDLYNQYSMFSDRENTDYGRYRDTVSDYNTERNYLTDRYYNESQMDYNRYNDAYNKAYGQYRDSVADWQQDLARADDNYFNLYDRDYNQYSDDRDLSYNNYRDSVKDEQWQKDFDEAKRQYDESLLEQQRQFDESLKVKKTDGDDDVDGDDVVKPADANSPGVRNFNAAIKTSYEYYARGGKSGTYNDYVYSTLEKWLDNGKLTESEAAALMNQFGF